MSVVQQHARRLKSISIVSGYTGSGVRVLRGTLLVEPICNRPGEVHITKYALSKSIACQLQPPAPWVEEGLR